MPTVTSMMRKLAGKHLVEYKRYRPLRLTKKGKKEARLIIRRHRLTELFLVEKMGFGWEEVHQIAEQLEHIQTKEFFERMDTILGFPKIDPHGRPIPDKIGLFKQKKLFRLSNRKVSEIVTLKAVENATDDFLKFLNKRDIRLGLEIRIHAIEQYDGSMMVSYGKKSMKLLVTPFAKDCWCEKVSQMINTGGTFMIVLGIGAAGSSQLFSEGCSLSGLKTSCTISQD